LPLAMAAPTPVTALVHSSILITAGVYLICFNRFLIETNVRVILDFLSIITIFISGIIANFENDFEEIKTKLDAVYGNSSPSMTTVRYWSNEFKRSCSSVLDDEELPGRPADMVTEEIVEKVHDMIFADRRMKVHEVAEAVGVYGTASNILHDNLEMKKLNCELLPHPPYSPDLASCDFFLFPNLKKWLGGKKFTSNEEVISETEVYFAEFRQIVFF
ncbi:NU5M oxidoreductase, partial [Acromyrmex heyeri]